MRVASLLNEFIAGWILEVLSVPHWKFIQMDAGESVGRTALILESEVMWQKYGKG